MVHGRSKPDDNRADSESKVQELISSFKKQFGSTKCYELTDCDLGTDDGQEQYHINEVYELCDKLVDFTTNKTLALIENDN